MPQCPAFYVGSGDLNSGLNACKPKLPFQSNKFSSELLASLRNKFMGTIQCFNSFIFGYTVSRQTCSLKSLMSDLSPTTSTEAMSVTAKSIPESAVHRGVERSFSLCIPTPSGSYLVNIELRNINTIQVTELTEANIFKRKARSSNRLSWKDWVIIDEVLPNEGMGIISKVCSRFSN